MIKGTTVTLIQKTKTGENELGEPEYRKDEVMVENVLVSPATNQERADTLNLYGHKLEYDLAIPKGDRHAWMNNDVVIFGKEFSVLSEEAEGIEENIPLCWNKKVRCGKVE